MNIRPASSLRSALLSILFAVAAGFFWWLFYERYYKYKDCIEASASSCITADGANLTSGGAIWSVIALVLSGFTAYYLGVLIRKRS